MDEKVKNALDNVDFIKSCIYESKENNTIIIKTSLFLSSVNLFYLFSGILKAKFLLPNNIFVSYDIVMAITIYLITVAFFYTIYRKYVIKSNKVYKSLFYLTTIINLFLPPVLMILRGVFITDFNVDNTSVILVKMQYLSTFCNILLLVFYLIISSYIIKIKALRIVSIIILIFNVIILIFFSDTVFLLNNSNIISGISSVHIFYYISMIIGYILIAIFLYNDRKKNEYK